MKCERYLELICRCLSDDMYTKLTRNIITYGEIIYVYGKVYMVVVYMILKLEITKLSYIESVMF